MKQGLVSRGVRFIITGSLIAAGAIPTTAHAIPHKLCELRLSSEKPRFISELVGRKLVGPLTRPILTKAPADAEVVATLKIDLEAARKNFPQIRGRFGTLMAVGSMRDVYDELSATPGLSLVRILNGTEIRVRGSADVLVSLLHMTYISRFQIVDSTGIMEPETRFSPGEYEHWKNAEQVEKYRTGIVLTHLMGEEFDAAVISLNAMGTVIHSEYHPAEAMGYVTVYTHVNPTRFAEVPFVDFVESPNSLGALFSSLRDRSPLYRMVDELTSGSASLWEEQQAAFEKNPGSVDSGIRSLYGAMASGSQWRSMLLHTANAALRDASNPLQLEILTPGTKTYQPGIQFDDFSELHRLSQADQLRVAQAFLTNPGLHDAVNKFAKDPRILEIAKQAQESVSRWFEQNYSATAGR